MRLLVRTFAIAGALAAHGAFGQDAAEIVRLQGRGEHRPDERSEWRPARVQLTLPAGSYVRTLQRESKMSLLLADQTQLNIEGVADAQVLRPEGAERKSIIDFTRGKARFETRTPTRDFKVRTPTGLAAIRGTEWLLEVDDDGTSRFTVVAGEIVISNELGSVSVAADEEGTLARGRAPSKRHVAESRERIQWVSAFEVDPGRYGKLRAEDLPATENCVPAACYVAADIEAYFGRFDAALVWIERAGNDPRKAALRAQLLAARGDLAGARQAAREAAAARPRTLEAALAVGEMARLDGDYPTAKSALREAAALAPDDPRGWLALGRLEAERGHLRAAGRAMEQAHRLAPRDASITSEQGLLALQANRLTAARSAMSQALSERPDDFITWTGIGSVRLASAAPTDALDALLKATLIEPRHARAQVALAIAYWQLGRHEDALSRLRDAAARDPRDPLPWQLRSMMLVDLMRPGEAFASAQEAVRRLAFVRSLDPIANDLRGSANLGAPLAQMGLEAWAMKVAQDSFDPLWAGSHLFLGDRLPGRFAANSELLQGFLADPLAFGASNRFQTLVRAPGAYGTVALRAAHASDSRLSEPLLNVNGLAADNRFAYFAEASRLLNTTDGGDDRATSYTAGLGVRPDDLWGAFLYANRIAPVSVRGGGTLLDPFQRVAGWSRRIDGGVAFKPDADWQLWLKAGGSDEDSRATTRDSAHFAGGVVFGDSALSTRPRRRDAGFRATGRASPLEAWLVLETSTLRSDDAFERDAFPRTAEDQPRFIESVTQDIDDHARTAAFGGRWRGDRLQAEGAIDATRYEKTDRIVVRRDYISQLVALDDDHSRSATGGRFGARLDGPAGLSLRGAYQHWLRPASTGSLLPTSTAGIVLDDRYVLPGGTLERSRVQLEWTAAERIFIVAFADRQRIDNLYSDIAGVLNNRPDSSNLERLRNRSFTPLASLTPLEGFAELSRGRLRETGITINALVAPELSFFAEAVHASSMNTGALYPGARLAFMPNDRQAVGLSYFSPARWTVAARAIHRGERFADEANTAPLPAEWNGAVQGYWETRDKRWSVEGIAAGIGAHSSRESYAIAVNYRF